MLKKFHAAVLKIKVGNRDGYPLPRHHSDGTAMYDGRAGVGVGSLSIRPYRGGDQKEHPGHGTSQQSRLSLHSFH